MRELSPTITQLNPNDQILVIQRNTSFRKRCLSSFARGSNGHAKVNEKVRTERKRELNRVMRGVA